MAELDWPYRDVPGGLGGTTTYGEQTQRSRILALRTSTGAAVQVSRRFSLGASAGVVYIEDRLKAALCFSKSGRARWFQNLAPSGGPMALVRPDFGAQFRLATKFTIGLAYRPPTVVHANGHASRNAAAQLQVLAGGFALVDPTFRYDVEVRTTIPQTVSAAAEWQALRLRLVGGIDWTDWSDAFDELVIDLSNGSNPAINSVVGSTSMRDVVPLRWRDQFVPRAGIEFARPSISRSTPVTATPAAPFLHLR